MIIAHVSHYQDGVNMARSPSPSQTADPGGSGPRNRLGPKTTVEVNAWALIVTVAGVFAFAISITTAAVGRLHAIEDHAKESAGRITALEQNVVTREDLRAANAMSLTAMRKLLGAAVIQCDKFGGDSQCKIMFHADAP